MDLNLTAIKDTTHPAHHFSLGQFFGYLLVGLAAYQKARISGAGSLLDPTILAPFLEGAMTVAQAQPDAGPAPSGV